MIIIMILKGQTAHTFRDDYLLRLFTAKLISSTAGKLGNSIIAKIDR